ncbi:MAG: hypothetical protein ABMA64_00790 [Myxococcota bacterium]
MRSWLDFAVGFAIVALDIDGWPSRRYWPGIAFGVLAILLFYAATDGEPGLMPGGDSVPWWTLVGLIAGVAGVIAAVRGLIRAWNDRPRPPTPTHRWIRYDRRR